jgi:hypothetical protein
MTSKNKNLKKVLPVLLILGFLLYEARSAYNSGEQLFFYMYLALIPLFFVCWGLSFLVSGGTVREIAKHLTDEERAESARLALSYGCKLGLFVAVPLGVMCVWCYLFLDIRSPLAYVAVFCIVMLLASPFMFRHWKKMRAFMLSTKYAKTQGYDKELPNKSLENRRA